ncbi:unnamed protein product [Phaedon cochleariae]|uniref:Major facilitator superfamily (MFS) profile domain-containing protein n=1 Tax=Phaedon cochleariae TaxID=80249 RepID=A0A9P0GPA1_PHACE|nr:unnamed protein product [Phaedon cochleariae]
MKIATRFWIGCMVFLTTYTCYTTRVNMSISIVSMTKKGHKSTPECIMKSESHNRNESNETTDTSPRDDYPDYGPRYEWSEQVQAQILASYFYGYAIFSLPAGFLAEYFGPFKIILIAHIIAAVFNTLCVYAIWLNWGVLCFCRIILGCCGGLIYPALQCLIAHWAPPEEKGKFFGALMGNVLGTCITWPMVGAITAAFGWDWGFYSVSIKNVIFCIIFFFVCADTPEMHSWISEDELKYIKEKQAGNVEKQKVIPPYLDIAKSPAFWVLAICHFGNEWGLYLQLVNVPKFISEVIGFKLEETGGLSSVAPLCRMIFGMIFGLIGDTLRQKQVMSLSAIRRMFTVSSHILTGALLIGIGFVGCNWIVVMLLLALSLGLNGACSQSNLQNPQDLAPNFAATIYGFNSFIGGCTGFLVPAVTGELTKYNNGIREWGIAFMLGGGIVVVCGLTWILFGSVKEQPWNRKGGPS